MDVSIVSDVLPPGRGPESIADLIGRLSAAPGGIVAALAAAGPTATAVQSIGNTAPAVTIPTAGCYRWTRRGLSAPARRWMLGRAA